MLDDQLPTYLYKPSDNALSSVLYFTHQGSEPSPVHLLRRPEPSSSRNAYALALADASFPDVIFAEILVEPEVAQPTLSAADIRAQSNAASAASVTAAAAPRRRRTGSSGTHSPPDGSLLLPVVPDTVVLRLYNPDQNVGVKMLPGGWSRTDAWEFEMPEKSFKLPSASMIDQHASTASTDVVDFAPKVVFRWKRDGRLSKDMTCYMTGKSVAGKKSKEPDITVAMYKGGKNESVMVYEPNLQRVDVQDRKGLEVVLLLSAAVIHDLYINVRGDPFNATAAAPSSPKLGAGLRFGSAGVESPPTAISRALASSAPASAPASSLPATSTHSLGGGAAYDTEARRLERQAEDRKQRERESRDAEEQQRIRMMLEKEERERQRRDAEVAAETERLKRLYGTQGQEYASSSPPPPVPPPRPGGGSGSAYWQTPLAGTSLSSSLGAGSALHGNPSPGGPSKWFSRDSLGVAYNGVAGASSSMFFGRGGGDDAAGKKLQKKKSMMW